jgi:hypothetical protein
MILGFASLAMFSLVGGIKKLIFVLPASLAFGFGVVYTLAASGVCRDDPISSID